MKKIDLSKIPPADALKSLDYEAVLGANIAKYKTQNPKWNAEVESDPVMAVLHVISYSKVQNTAEYNDGIRACMVATATKADLDNLAANLGLERQLISAATNDSPAVYEKDERLKRRIVLAPEGYTTAGSHGAYEFWALSHAKVKAVNAFRDTENCVTVVLLGYDGDGAVNAEIVAQVTQILNPNDRRPLTDKLTVQSAIIEPFNIDATLKIYGGVSAAVVEAQAHKGLKQYLTDINEVGADVPKSGIIAALMVQGVERVIIAGPVDDISISNIQAAYCGLENITLNIEVINV